MGAKSVTMERILCILEWKFIENQMNGSKKERIFGHQRKDLCAHRRKAPQLFAQFPQFLAIIRNFFLFIEWIDIRNCLQWGIGRRCRSKRSLEGSLTANDSLGIWQDRSLGVLSRGPHCHEQSHCFLTDHSWGSLRVCPLPDSHCLCLQQKHLGSNSLLPLLCQSSACVSVLCPVHYWHWYGLSLL